MKNFKFKNAKLIFVLLIMSLFVVSLLYYNFVFLNIFSRNSFANEMIALSDENENSIFNVQKLLIYSSANAIDNSTYNSLEDVSIYQYTDLSIYIDNREYIAELTDENTVKELYIDNINLSSNSEVGTQLLNYKNPNDFGKYSLIEFPNNGRIDFNIVNTNDQRENANYSNPTFFTDCSDPITLGYLNKDILTGYSVSENSNTVSFNGKVLQEANIDIQDINFTLNFTINITNNLNQKFAYNMSLDIDLNDENGGIYNGYVYRNISTSGEQYNFFKEV